MSENSQSDAEAQRVARISLVFSPYWKVKEAGVWCQQRMVAVVTAAVAATG